MLETKHWKKRKSATLIANITAKLKTMSMLFVWHLVLRILFSCRTCPGWLQKGSAFRWDNTSIHTAAVQYLNLVSATAILNQPVYLLDLMPADFFCCWLFLMWRTPWIGTLLLPTASVRMVQGWHLRKSIHRCLPVVVQALGKVYKTEWELWGKKVKNKFTLGPKQQNIFHLPGFEANPIGRFNKSM